MSNRLAKRHERKPGVAHQGFATGWTAPSAARAYRFAPRGTRTAWFPRGSRLHIGCGNRRLAGWINADAVAGVGDVVFDLHDELPRDTFAEIYGSHVLEHCWPQDTPAILKRLHDSLLPGGTLRLSVPDLRLVVKNCVDGHAYGDERSALAVIYGGEFSKNTAAPDLHRQAFWKERLERLLNEAGFVNVRAWSKGQYPAIDALKDYATQPCSSDGRSLISLNLEANRSGELPKIESVDGAVIDVSVILGTVDRPELLKECIEAVRRSLLGISYEIVVAYGRESDASLPWMRSQPDIVPVLGGMDGAIEAFNRAYSASRGRLICQINDDVIVDSGSIARAVQHLDASPATSGVVFKFDRGDGRGYRHENFSDFLHPNQIVVRREACEAIVERIGGFWGGAAHRTDKTYGGDSAFGVMCKHLGFRLDSVDGVTCQDMLAPDALRARNQAAVAKDHGPRWQAMYQPLAQSSAPTAQIDEWPHCYIPRRGMPPRRSPVEAGRPLRLLHLGLMSKHEPQTSMCSALAKIGPTVVMTWRNNKHAVLEAIRAHRPDLIWAQVQSDAWDSEFAKALRGAAGPQCTVAMWTGDVRSSGAQRVEPWLARAGHDFDLVLASNTTYPRKLKVEEKVPAACGYMLCGAEASDEQVLSIPEASHAGAVFFGANYYSLDNGFRERLFTEVRRANPCQLSVYGHGWEKFDFGKAFVNKAQSRAIMRRAPLTVVTSLHVDLGRYSSDRLARAAASGAVMVVREFEDMKGVGLMPGENCLSWKAPGQLAGVLREWSKPTRAAERAKLREGAVALAKRELIWDRSVEGLLAIVRDLRARRGLC